MTPSALVLSPPLQMTMIGSFFSFLLARRMDDGWGIRIHSRVWSDGFDFDSKISLGLALQDR